MVNENHLDMIMKGVTTWNEWRWNNTDIIDLSNAELDGARLHGAKLKGADLSGAKLYRANLCGADLSGADLCEADLSGANLHGARLNGAKLKGTKLHKADLHKADLHRAYLHGADLRGADLSMANLPGAILQEANLNRACINKADLSMANLYRACISKADLSGANLSKADLSKANLCGADLSGAILHGAILHWAILQGANLRGADLSEGKMVGTNFSKANLTGCRIYGVHARDLKLLETSQLDLIITPDGEHAITADNFEFAQFVYLRLKNEKMSDVIEAEGKKGVLILGRFTPEDRKAVLNAIREKLRKNNYVPIVFDFDRPTERDFTETIKTLTGFCRFIIADLTNPKSSPLDLQANIPDYRIPLVRIIQEKEEPFSIFNDLQKYNWVVKELLNYDSASALIEVFEDAVIKPALNMYTLMTIEKGGKLQTDTLIMAE